MMVMFATRLAVAEDGALAGVDAGRQAGTEVAHAREAEVVPAVDAARPRRDVVAGVAVVVADGHVAPRAGLGRVENEREGARLPDPVEEASTRAAASSRAAAAPDRPPTCAPAVAACGYNGKTSRQPVVHGLRALVGRHESF